MEGLQDPYKPISRILGSWVAAKAKGDMELAEGGEKNGEEKLEKGSPLTPAQRSPYSPHIYLGPRLSIEWYPGLFSGPQRTWVLNLVPNHKSPHGFPQYDPDADSHGQADAP